MKNIRKMFLLFCAVVTILFCFAFSVSALNSSGQCGDNVHWDYNTNTKELVVSGSGKMWDYELESSPFYDSDIKSVVISYGVTSIGDDAFSSCYNLKNISIGDSVETIGSFAFYDCDSLSSVTISDSVISIGDDSFRSCDSLYSVIFGNSVETIGSSAFLYCDRLTSITIGDRVTTIGVSAFDSCENLTSITIGKSVKTIGAFAFYYCNNLTVVYYNDTREQWKNIEIGLYNENLINANIYYNCEHPNEVQYTLLTPTCTETGYTAGIYCPDCEKWIEGHEEISAINHKNKISPVQQNPTCTEIGYTAGTYCPDCIAWLEGHEVIPALNHKNKISHIQQNPTCIEIGYTAGTYCPDCKVWLEGHEVIPALNHKNKTSHIQQNPTCIEIGYTAGTYCPDCKVWLEGHEVIPVSGHTEVVDKAVLATEKENGLTEGSHCSVCGVVLVKQEIIPAVLQNNGSYYTVDPVASGNLNNAITLESGQMYYREYTSKYHSRYWYAKFIVKENSYASIGFTAKYYYDFSIRDENGYIVKDFGSKQKYDGYFPLEAGTYYVVLNNKSYSNNSVVLSYSLFENVFCEREPNDTFTTATTIGFDQKYLVFSNDSYNNDYLSFNTKKGQKITVYVYGFEESNPSVSLYESDRNTYYSISMNLKFDEKKKVYYYDFTSKYDGTYFIRSNCSKSGLCYSIELNKADCSKHNLKTTTTKATISKNGKIVSECSICGYTKTTNIYTPNSIKLSKTSYTYNGKKKTPSVTIKDSKGKTLKKDKDYTVSYAKGRKAIGKYTVTVTFKGNYSGTKKLTFEIVPAKATLSKLTAGKSQLTATWKTISSVTGYEVQYSTSKKFTKNTTKTVKIKSAKTKKTTIKKLKKGKKYYVRIRAYKTVNGKKIYGAWSKVKNVKVK